MACGLRYIVMNNNELAEFSKEQRSEYDVWQTSLVNPVESATMQPLPPPPAGLESTRIALHRLATCVIAPARHRVAERFGLRATEGGFGTPSCDDRRIRIEGGNLIHETGDNTESTSITALKARDRLAQG